MSRSNHPKGSRYGWWKKPTKEESRTKMRAREREFLDKVNLEEKTRDHWDQVDEHGGADTLDDVPPVPKECGNPWNWD